MEHWVNKVALVTGVTSGIGKAVAEQLVDHGMKVVGIARRIDKMKLLVEEWKTKTGKLIPIQCDLGNQNEIMRTMEWIEKNVGVVELLVNNAAVHMPSSIIEGNMDEWKKSLDINILGVVLLIKEMMKQLKKKGLNSGMIINVNDICAWNMIMMKCDRPMSTSYVTTKHALRGLTDHLRMELMHMHSNVKVISVIPSMVDTEMTEKTMKDRACLALMPKDVADMILLTIQAPDAVLVQDMVITPTHQTMMN